MTEYGYCQCGCGQRTKIAEKTIARYGYVKGEPRRFVRGHSTRLPEHRPDFGPKYEERECGFSSACWVWLRARNKKGYGLFSRAQGGRLAHRILYEGVHGPVPEGFELDHLCRTRACVNPAHLEIVSHAENMRRGYAVVRGELAEGFGGELKRARIAAGLSQTGLARKLGCSQGAIWGWESNRWTPHAEVQSRLPAVLGFDPMAMEQRREAA